MERQIEEAPLVSGTAGREDDIREIHERFLKSSLVLVEDVDDANLFRYENPARVVRRIAKRQGIPESVIRCEWLQTETALLGSGVSGYALIQHVLVDPVGIAIIDIGQGEILAELLSGDHRFGDARIVRYERDQGSASIVEVGAVVRTESGKGSLHPVVLGVVDVSGVRRAFLAEDTLQERPASLLVDGHLVAELLQDRVVPRSQRSVPDQAAAAKIFVVGTEELLGGFEWRSEIQTLRMTD